MKIHLKLVQLRHNFDFWGLRGYPIHETIPNLWQDRTIGVFEINVSIYVNQDCGSPCLMKNTCIHFSTEAWSL